MYINKVNITIEDPKNPPPSVADAILALNANDKFTIINDDIENCYKKIENLIDAEINNGPKDYDREYIRKHVEKLTI